MSDLLGSADLGLAGDNPGSQANVNRKVNNKQRNAPGQQPAGQGKPKPPPQKPAVPEPKVGRSKQPLGNLPQEIKTAEQPGGPQKAWADRPLQSQHPILNVLETAPDAGWMLYQGSRYITQGMKAFQTSESGMATTSVQNLWEQQSAWAKLAQSALTAMADTPPGIGAQNAYYSMYGGGGNMLTPFHSTPEEQARAMVGGIVDMALDPNIWALGMVPGGGEADVAAEGGEAAAKVGGEAAEEAPAAAATVPEGTAAAAPEAAQAAAEAAPSEAATAAAPEEETAASRVEPQTPEATAAEAKVQAIAKELAKQSPQAVGQVGWNIAQDPNPTPQSLLLDIGLGIIMTGGVVTPGTRALLHAMGPAWERVGTSLGNQYLKALQQQMDLDGNAVTRQGLYDELFSDVTETGAMKPYRKLEQTAPEGEVGESMRDPLTGELKVTRDKYRSMLTSMGLESHADLVDHLTAGDLTDSQVQTLSDNFQYSGLQANLVRVGDGEVPLVNPAAHLKDLPSADFRKGSATVSAVKGFVNHAYDSPVANEGSPEVSLWRSLIGFTRNTNWLHEHAMTTFVNLLGDDARNPAVQRDLFKAAEGDQEVYDRLSPNQKMVADSWRVMVAAMRRVSNESGYAHNFTDYWVPRMPVLTKEMKDARGEGTGGSELMTGERRKARSVSAQMVPLDPTKPDSDEEIQLRNRYQSVFDLNNDVKVTRANLVDEILNPEVEAKAVEADAAEVKAIRKMADPAAAKRAAQKLATRIHPDYETNFLAAANRGLGRQMRAIHSYQAMTVLKDTTLENGKAAAYDLKDLGDDPGRRIEDLGRLGYVQPESGFYKGWMVDKDFNDLLQRGKRAADRWYLTGKGGVGGKVVGGLLELERKAIAMIMYSPMIHGLNMAGRFGLAYMDHPMQMTKYLTREGAGGRLSRLLDASQSGLDDNDMALRQEAYNYGVAPPPTAKNWNREAYSSMADALGDTTVSEIPGVTDDGEVAGWAKKSGLDKLGNLAKPVKSAWDYSNKLLWKNVNDFGVMMYWIEKEGLLKQGSSETDAGLMAARRANSWMGHVNPEDTNPMMHDLARTIFFAPNWWRTWGELLSGVYKNSGTHWDSRTITNQVANDIRVGMSAFAFQKLSGNVMNYALSGHMQDQNLKGNQDKVEITRPAIIEAMQAIPGMNLAQGIDPQTGKNPTTGAVLTVENPFARQEFATEGAMGLESGQAGKPLFKVGGLQVSGPPSMAAVGGGIEKQVASRMSPLAESIAAAANIDLYNSIVQNQVKHLNPNETVGLDDVAMAALELTPLGYTASNAIEQGEGVYGTQTQPSIGKAIGGLSGGLSQTLATGLTGVNPPTEYAQKTAGQPLGDAQYQQIQSINNTYDKQMTTLQKEVVANQITYDQWRTEYEQLTVQRAATLQAFYARSPQYMGGTDGLVAQYEALYSSPQVQNADGTINYDVLDQLQQKFAGAHTSAQMNAVNTAISKTEQKYPTVKAYKDAINSYYTFQDQWAKTNGFNVYSLQGESSEYGVLYGTPQATLYLGEHPALNRWEIAKRNWLRTPQGYSYGLFEGSSTAVKAALAAAQGSYVSPATRAANPNAAAQYALDQQVTSLLVQQLIAQGTPAATATTEASKLLGAPA